MTANMPSLPSELHGINISSHTKNVRSFPAGEVIFDAGQKGGEMFLILEGEILIALETAEIDRLGPGDIFGEMALVENGTRSARAIATAASKLLCLGRVQFADLLRESPDFALHVMSVMSARIRKFMGEEVRRQRLEEEMRIGREIQLSLIPDACPGLHGWDFAAAYHAAREVGGDFYDFVFVPQNADDMQLVVADVTGKGVPAALFMASCRTTIRSEAIRGNGPAATLTCANRVIALDTHFPLFLTVFCARLNSQSGSVSYANGGHERPLLLRAKTGLTESLISHNPLLGFTSAIEYKEHAIELEAGDFLICFTDGVTEARNEQGEFYGDERLQMLVESEEWQSADDLLRGIVDSVAAFSDGCQPADDLTLVVARRVDSKMLSPANSISASGSTVRNHGF